WEACRAPRMAARASSASCSREHPPKAGSPPIGLSSVSPPEAPLFKWVSCPFSAGRNAWLGCDVRVQLAAQDQDSAAVPAALEDSSTHQREVATASERIVVLVVVGCCWQPLYLELVEQVWQHRLSDQKPHVSLASNGA